MLQYSQDWELLVYRKGAQVGGVLNQIHLGSFSNSSLAHPQG